MNVFMKKCNPPKFRENKLPFEIFYNAEKSNNQKFFPKNLNKKSKLSRSRQLNQKHVPSI